MDEPKMTSNRPPDPRERVFFTTTFALLARLAKADGSVCLQELAILDRFIHEELRCAPDMARLATSIFIEARDSTTPTKTFAKAFTKTFAQSANIRVALLEILVDLAFADHHIHPAEMRLLQEVAKSLKIKESVLQRITLCEHSCEDNPSAVLGCPEDARWPDIEEAYRELDALHNPEMLHQVGLPIEFLHLAQKRQKRLSRALETLRLRWTQGGPNEAR